MINVLNSISVLINFSSPGLKIVKVLKYPFRKWQMFVWELTLF